LGLRLESRPVFPIILHKLSFGLLENFYVLAQGGHAAPRPFFRGPPAGRDRFGPFSSAASGIRFGTPQFSERGGLCKDSPDFSQKSFSFPCCIFPQETV
jgi:hypothetical protein